jgi:hypothetical protein
MHALFPHFGRRIAAEVDLDDDIIGVEVVMVDTPRFGSQERISGDRRSAS